ncbi:hypothetical protein HKD37_06G016445 [Glycine soja]
MSKRLQEDWARAAKEGPRVLMNLRTHLLLEVASPFSLPSPFRCHSSSKKQRNPLMKKILGLQAPMELTSPPYITIREWEESKEFSDCVVLNSLTREKGDTKEFRRLVLPSFGKERRKTQKEFRRLVLGEFFLAKGEENEKDE